MVLLKVLLITGLLLTAYQDIRERQVLWLLFPIIALCSGGLHYNSTLWELFAANVMVNLGFVFSLFIVIFLYANLKLKTAFKRVFGPGDVLMFLSLALSFATISFLVVFVFALLFSMALHLILKKGQKNRTVPLAGYMGLFFTMAYLAQWSGIIKNLYSI